MKNQNFFIHLILVIMLFNIINSTKYKAENGNRNLQQNNSMNDSDISNNSISNSTKNNTNEPYVPNASEKNDKFNISIYKSNMDRKILTEYDRYIVFKEKFYVTDFKFYSKFSPESKEYNKIIYKIGSYWFVVAGMTGFLFLLYLIGRILFGKFKGTKKDNLESDYKYIAWGLFLVGFTSAFIFFTLSSIRSKSSLDSLLEISDFIKKKSMDAYNYAKNVTDTEVKLKNLNFTLKNFSEDYSTNLIGSEELIKNIKVLQLNSTKLQDKIGNKEKMKFTLEINILVFISILTFSGLIAFKFSKKNLVIFISILIYLLLIPIFVIQGYSFSFMVYSVDMCKDVKNIIEKGLDPKQEKGIGYFITCPAKLVRKSIYTSKYVLSKSFDLLMADVNSTLSEYLISGMVNVKRDNLYFYSLKSIYQDKSPRIKDGLQSMILFNHILIGLESLSQCEFALSSINYIEEKFCYKTIEEQSYSLIYYFIGALGILFLSIGLNKMSVLAGEEKINKKHVPLMESLN